MCNYIYVIYLVSKYTKCGDLLYYQICILYRPTLWTSKFSFNPSVTYHPQSTEYVISIPIWKWTGHPSLNIQSCIKGLFVVRDFCFWAIGQLGQYIKKVGSRLWAMFEGGFFMFSGSKKFLLNILATALKSYIKWLF